MTEARMKEIEAAARMAFALEPEQPEPAAKVGSAPYFVAGGVFLAIVCALAVL